MTRKNQINSEEVLFWQQYQKASAIKELFPKVALLIVKYTFYADGGAKMIKNDKTEYKPQDKAFFRINCVQRECVKGGYDLLTVIADILNANQENRHDRLFCKGWQDMERIGKYHCLYELHYDITVQYF